MEKEQSDDQFGFREKRRIEDVFSILENVVGKTNEWNLPLWMVSIDLRKAFDRILHVPLFDALRAQCVPEGDIQLLAALYSNQQGFVNGSRAFEIQRGVKQGDIISPLLFNASIESAFRAWKHRLLEHGFLLAPNTTRFTNTRYADDVMLFAKSIGEVVEMVELLIEEFAKFGLELNASKTKFITNDVVEYMFVDIGGSMVSIVDSTAEHRFLGRYLSGDLDRRANVEVQHRIKTAWMKFGQHTNTLCNRNISIKLRMKLFDSVVSPSLLFGLAILPLQVSCIEKLDIIQRKMLRKIVGWVRIPEELWNETMRRMSSKVEHALKTCKVKVWSIRLAEMHWKFIARLKRLPPTSWQSLAAHWQPFETEDISCEFLPNRTRGHLVSRWDDRISKFSWKHFGKRWQDIAPDDFSKTFTNLLGEALST